MRGAGVQREWPSLERLRKALLATPQVRGKAPLGSHYITEWIVHCVNVLHREKSCLGLHLCAADSPPFIAAVPGPEEKSASGLPMAYSLAEFASELRAHVTHVGWRDHRCECRWLEYTEADCL